MRGEAEIARRRAEEERAEALFPLRVTTKSADSKRDARAVHKKWACYLDVKIVLAEV
jgi:hypothetical protein